MNKKLIRIILILLFIPSMSWSVQPAVKKDVLIDVDFDNANLKEIVFTVSDFTGAAFVFTDIVNTPISWTQKGLLKEDIISTFTKVISSVGYNCQLVQGKNNFYSIKVDSQIAEGTTTTSVGVYHLQNIAAESVFDSVEVLYGTRLSLGFFEQNSSIVFSGSSGLVTDFMSLIERLDKPMDTDIVAIRLRHVSVKAAMKALVDTKLLEENSFYPDYWNRSVVIKGSPYIRNVALAIVDAIDKPQSGWTDQLEYIHTVDSEAITELLNSACENVEVRTVAPDRILISGFEKDVEKASNLLHKIDGTGLQVKVEAIIAYLTDREFYELGLKMSYGENNFFGSLNNNLSSNLINSNTGLLLDYFTEILGLTFAAKEGMAHGEIISSPVLTVLNGQEARIHVGQNVPYLSQANFNQNDGTDTGTSIERKDIGITFTIKPAIEPGGEFVHLEVSQEVSNVTDDSELSQDAVDIILDKKEIKTTVIVADGDTIFLGGLRSEESGKGRDFVPLLGELPILGKLFTYDVEQKETRHLIVSLRVKVIGEKI